MTVDDLYKIIGMQSAEIFVLKQDIKNLQEALRIAEELLKDKQLPLPETE